MHHFSLNNLRPCVQTGCTYCEIVAIFFFFFEHLDWHYAFDLQKSWVKLNHLQKYHYYTPFTGYNRLSSRLSNRFGIRFDNRVERTATVRSTGFHCSFNRLSNRVVQPVWQPAVYTIEPVVKPVVKPVWHPVWQQVVSFNRGFRVTRSHVCYATCCSCNMRSCIRRFAARDKVAWQNRALKSQVWRRC